MISIVTKRSSGNRAADNARFLELCPDIIRHARFAFRNSRVELREEAICEVVAHAFCAFRRLAALGKRDLAYASPLARFGIARVRSGRPVGSKLNSRDVYATLAQRWRGRVFGHSRGFESIDWIETLVNDRLTSIPDLVAFRMDFSAWLSVLSQRDRKLAEFLALGNSTSAAARRFRVSRARVSQLRSELQSSWQEFQGESPASAH